jgi:hypothetical protein
LILANDKLIAIVTHEELVAIRARTEATTAGPWYFRILDDRQFMNLVSVSTVPETEVDSARDEFPYQEIIAVTLVQSLHYVDDHCQRWEDNAVFIAHSRIDIDFIVAEIDLLRDSLESERPIDVTKVIPKIELMAIKERFSRATRGPWQVRPVSDESSMTLLGISASSNGAKETDYRHYAAGEMIAAALVQNPKYAVHQSGKWAENAEFIAHSPVDISRLWFELYRLRELAGLHSGQ